MENAVETVEAIEMPVSTSKGIGGKIGVGVGLAALGAVGALVWKNRAKFEERKIKKLEKKGYVVLKEEDVVEIEEVSNETEETK